jgi:hypothetical protein
MFWVEFPCIFIKEHLWYCMYGHRGPHSPQNLTFLRRRDSFYSLSLFQNQIPPVNSKYSTSINDITHPSVLTFPGRFTYFYTYAKRKVCSNRTGPGCAVPVIPATQEVQVRRMSVWGQPGGKVSDPTHTQSITHHENEKKKKKLKKKKGNQSKQNIKPTRW